MYLENYDYITGDLIGSFTTFDFGNLIQNQHCLKPLVFRLIPDQETSLNNIKIYLENKGTWKDTDFGYYIAQSFQPSIESGSSFFHDHFTEVPNASSASPNGVPIPWDSTTRASQYVWLDTQITAQTGLNDVNFRLFYDFI
jgi:hypothetical protein